MLKRLLAKYRQRREEKKAARLAQQEEVEMEREFREWIERWNADNRRRRVRASARRIAEKSCVKRLSSSMPLELQATEAKEIAEAAFVLAEAIEARAQKA